MFSNNAYTLTLLWKEYYNKTKLKYPWDSIELILILFTQF